ncbi:MAG: type III PLP-dependent enzyme [Planctomycetaceae bacterium]
MITPLVASASEIFAATRQLETPFVRVDLHALTRNVAALRAALPSVEVWYALKCNPHPQIATTLADLGVGFEVASPQELRLLLSLGIPPDRIICLHTIKAHKFVRQLHDAGVRVMAVDCQDEIEKIASLAPDSRVVIRLEVASHGSRVPLGGKFGCSPDEAVALNQYAARVGLRLAGVTLHVGSQCESLPTWVQALETCRAVCERLCLDGRPAEIISLGGGLPVPYTASVPDLPSICEVIRSANPHRFGTADCRVTIEPGRAIAATAGTLIVSVVATAQRGGIRWVYLDAGTHHGLFEWLPAAGGLTMPIIAEPQDRPLQPCRLAGPTCDSIDVLPGIFELPELRAGDRLAFCYAGAYSTATASRFNGFEPPAIVIAGTEGATDA